MLETALKVSVFGVFWSVFSDIRIEYGEILIISPYSFRMRENTDQKTPNTEFTEEDLELCETFKSFLQK